MQRSGRAQFEDIRSGQELRRRTRDDHIAACACTDLLEQTDFEIFPVRRALLDEVGPRNRLGHAGGIAQPVRACALGDAEPLERRPGVLDETPELRLSLRVRIGRDHVHAAGQEIGGPTAPDGARADTGDEADV